MRSPVPAVASPSMCEVRGLYAATPAEGPQRERVSGLRTLISVGLKGDLKQEIKALLALGRNLKEEYKASYPNREGVMGVSTPLLSPQPVLTVCADFGEGCENLSCV